MQEIQFRHKTTKAIGGDGDEMRLPLVIRMIRLGSKDSGLLTNKFHPPVSQLWIGDTGGHDKERHKDREN